MITHFADTWQSLLKNMQDKIWVNTHTGYMNNRLNGKSYLYSSLYYTLLFLKVLFPLLVFCLNILSKEYYIWWITFLP